VAARGLRGREIDDVAEDAADRRADDVNDPQTGACHTHEPETPAQQNRRHSSTGVVKEVLPIPWKIEPLTRRKP
jgi:hypothetical protein